MTIYFKSTNEAFKIFNSCIITDLIYLLFECEILQASPEDVFQPVKCAVCDTNVAVMDQDEVFHFFNVLAGYS